jgi:acyl transferase domain-containing protein
MTTLAPGRGSRQAAVDPIAVIGMAGRFPGADSVAEFWRRLSGDEVCGTDLPRPAQAPGNWVGRAYRVDEPEGFDRRLFGMTARDAAVTDPQHRLLLECAHQALEDSAIDPARHAGTIGIYAGCDISGYLMQHHGHDLDTLPVGTALALVIGNDKDHLCTRISYRLGLTGPSVSVQTGCSTSLAAVHLACQSLRNGECEVALAGGVSLRYPRDTGWLYDPDLIDSRDGMCRPFDAESDGTVPGEGGAIVVLKPLRDAIRDGDHIYGSLLGSAISNDGAHRAGYTSPGVDGQREAVRRALGAAGVSANDVTFVEAHGTGTRLGDPIEVRALTEAFRADTARTQYCAIGSVKSNVGHLNSAAGVAGLIKALLAIGHGVIPGTPTFRSPNPHLDLSSSPFYVNARSIPWNAEPHRRLAGISSLGLGGTNVHVIAGPAPVRAAPGRPADRPVYLLPISAQSPSALEARTRQVTEYLSRDEAGLAAVAATLTLGRRQMDVRRAVAARSAKEAIRLLTAPAPPADAIRPAEQVALLFGGQGAQFVRMGQELYRQESSFRQHVDRCAELLADRSGLDFRPVLFPADQEVASAEEALADTLATQQALFAVQTGIAEFLLAHGLRPAALVGQSIGEVAAAYVAGILDLEQAADMVAVRATVMRRARSGAAFTVSLPEADAARLLAGIAEVSGVNSATEVIASCDDERAEAMERALAATGCRYRRLRTSKPFHSGHMDDAAQELADRFTRIGFSAPRIPLISTVTGEYITDEQAKDPGYWSGQVRSPVRSRAALLTLLDIPGLVCVDVGPGHGMSRLLRMNATGQPVSVLACLPRAGDGPLPSPASMLGWLWERGLPVDLTRLVAEDTVRARLPGYPVERERYTLNDSPRLATAPRPATAPGPAGNGCVAEPDPAQALAVEAGPPDGTGDVSHIARIVSAVVSEVLGSPLEENDDFFAAGLDSLSATQVIGRLAERIHSRLTVRELFDHSTIRDLTERLSGRTAELA